MSLETIEAGEAELFESLALENRSGWVPGKGRAISAKLARQKDEILKLVISSLGAYPGKIAIVAVGGYGRDELSPGSDLDILILTEKAAKADELPWISRFTRQLWDLGYTLGASTRSLSECRIDARADFQFLSSLFQTRLIYGDNELYEKLGPCARKALDSRRAAFLAMLREGLDESLAELGMQALIKEPDLKLSPGGLRSVHSLQWIAFTQYGDARLESLGSLLPASEHRRLEAAYDLILYIRNHLHFELGRKEDSLRIEYQAKAALAVGLKGNDAERMTRLMRHFYEKASQVTRCLLAAREKVFPDPKRKTRRKGIASFDYAETKAIPLTAYDSLLAFSKEGRKADYSLIRFLSLATKAFSPADRVSREAFVRLRELLSQGNSYAYLQAMKLSGFLYRAIPPLAYVRDAIVYNPFHAYTIDQHSLEAVKSLELLGNPKAVEADKERLSALADLASVYAASLWIVKLALLLHDAGKAFEGDHAKNSTELAWGFLSSLPTEALIKEMIVFLVENHLLLSDMSRRSSMGGDDAIENLAREFSLRAYPDEALDLLYLLTYADVSATNGRGHSGYAASLLLSLYLRTRAAIRDARSIAESETGYLDGLTGELVASGADPRIHEFLSVLGKRYAFSNSPVEIRADYFDCESLRENGHRLRVRVYNDHVKVKLIARDSLGIFATTCGILLLNGADIVRADVHTYGQVAIDEFVITSLFGNEVLEQKMNLEISAWIEGLEKAFTQYLDGPAELHERISYFERRMKPINPAFKRPTLATVKRLEDGSLRCELSCTDRPALLYDLAHYIAMNGFDLRSATIDTTGWYVRDSFTLTCLRSASDEMLQTIELELAELANADRRQ